MMLDGSGNVFGSTPGPGTGRPPPATTSLEIGTVVREYTLDKLLGKGGMGEVYRAEHVHTGQQVAVKVLFPDLLRDEQGSARFVEEARVMAGMRHANIVQFINFFEQDGRFFLVMEYIDGPTLDDVLEQKPLDWEEAVRVGNAVLSALEYAHSRPQPVIHRDIKPANIMLAKDGRVVVTDFGVAKAVGRERLTKTRGVVGTYEYMSPEQVQGTEVSPATDVYAFAITFYRMLTGVVPFPQKADTGIDCMNAHLKAPVPSLVEFREGLPGWLQSIIERGLAKAPRDRYSSAGKMKKAIANARKAAETPPKPVKPPPPPVAEAEDPSLSEGEDLTRDRRVGLWVGLGVVAAVIVGLIVGVGFGGKKGEKKSGGPQEKQWAVVKGKHEEAEAAEAREAADEEQAKREELKNRLEEEKEEKARLARELEEARRITEEEAEKKRKEQEAEKRRIEQEQIAARQALLLNLPSSMVLLEAGDYPVGCWSGNSNCYDDEKPPRKVTLKAFGIMKREVTMEDYDICVAETACPKAGKGKRCNWQKSGKESHPINCVDWTGASAYCTYKGWRLPTEMEWEAAARGKTKDDYPWGNGTPNCGRTVMTEGRKGGCGSKGTNEAGSTPSDKSWAGVMDMGGNVREWVSSAYGAYPEGSVDSGMKGMVNRGGSWQMEAGTFSTSHTRNSDAVDEKRPDLGFRCAVSLE